METEICILGAGFSGIGAGDAARRAGRNAVLFDQNKDWGGLCSSFLVDRFRFDQAVHLSFAKDPLVQKVFYACPHNVYPPESTNYSNGVWIRHPVQNNLRSLPVEERVNIIRGFIDRPHDRADNTYDDWLRVAFGTYFAEHYPARYTRKYWGTEARELSDTWCGSRLYRPDLNEVLRGSFPDAAMPENVYYAKKMHYPKEGGFRAFLAETAERLDIRRNYRVTQIDAAEHIVHFANGETCHYERLVSTLPLPEMPRLLCINHADVHAASNQLHATSMALVSVGFRRQITFPALWFYVYDEDIPFARVHSPSWKSPANAPDGCSSLQFEIYYSKERPLTLDNKALVETVLACMERMNLARREDVCVCDCRHVQYGNVIYYLGMEQHRDVVRHAVEAQDVTMCGRFGEWGYLWSDQSFLSGRQAVQRVCADA